MVLPLRDLTDDAWVGGDLSRARRKRRTSRGDKLALVVGAMKVEKGVRVHK